MPVRDNLTRRKKIKYRIRKRVIGTAEKPRLVIYRSLNNIYAQLVDDINKQVVVSASSLSPEIKEEIKTQKTKVNKSKTVGLLIAQKAISKNIKEVVFDRNGYLYHGRIKAVADEARKTGLIF